VILVIGGEKGGTGKTTLAVNIAVERAKSGADVLLVDTDPQGSSNYWAEVRGDENIEPVIRCIQKYGKGLAKQLHDLQGRYEDVIVDAGGRDSIELRMAFAVANKAYIPVQASGFDMWTIMRMSQTVEQASILNPEMQASLVINRAPTNPGVREAAEAQEYVAEYQNLEMCPITVHERIAFRKAASEGRAVSELKRLDEKAAKEVKALYKVIYDA